MNTASAAVRFCVSLATFVAGTAAHRAFGPAQHAGPELVAPPPLATVMRVPAPAGCAEKLDRYLNFAPRSMPGDALRSQADALAAAECYAQAEALLLKAARHNPTDEAVLYDLGYLYSSLGRHDEALEALRKGLRLAPADEELNGELGYTLNALGRPSQAVAPLLRDLAADLTDAYVYASLSDSYLQMGRRREAYEYARRAVELGSYDEPALDNAAGTLLDLGREEPGHTAEAESALRAALESEPDSLYSNFLMGNLLAAEGRFEESEASFGLASDAAPESPYEYLMRGWARLRLGRAREAAEDARHYLRLVEWKGHNAPYAAVLAHFALRHDGRTDEAVAVLEEAARQPGAKTFGYKIAEFLRGRLSEERLLAAAADEAELTAAHGYAALSCAFSFATDAERAALRHADWVHAKGSRQFVAYAFVLSERESLRSDR